MTQQSPVPKTHFLLSGSTSWDLIGRKTLPKAVANRGNSRPGPQLICPTRLQFTGLPSDTTFVSIYTGPLAAHLVLIDDKGAAYGLGRNDSAQLGLPDLISRHHPVLLKPPLDPSERIVHATCGRQHTILVSDSGRAFSVGHNAFGQLANGSTTELRQPEVSEWQIVALPPAEHAVQAAAGADFSLIATKSGAVFAAGSGQYGQLGQGRTGETIGTGNRVVYAVEKTPVPVDAFGAQSGRVRAKQIAAGSNHALVLDENGKVWSWGFGGYGRLGHTTPKDELRPRLIDTFKADVYSIDAITAGASSSFAIQTQRKSMYMWGVTKKSGESNMYPKPIFDLQGWVIRSMSSGPSSTAVASERSVITWGGSPTFGELGYGKGVPKSSTKPKAVDSLEGLVTKQVAMGGAFCGMIVEVGTGENAEEEKSIFDKLPILEICEDSFDNNSGVPKETTKRKATVNTKGKGKAKSKKRRK